MKKIDIEIFQDVMERVIRNGNGEELIEIVKKAIKEEEDRKQRGLDFIKKVQSVSQPEIKNNTSRKSHDGSEDIPQSLEELVLPEVENNTGEKILKGIFGEDKRDEEDKKLDQRIVESHEEDNVEIVFDDGTSGVCKWCGGVNIIRAGEGMTHYYYCNDCEKGTDLIERKDNTEEIERPEILMDIVHRIIRDNDLKLATEEIVDLLVANKKEKDSSLDNTEEWKKGLKHLILQLSMNDYDLAEEEISEFIEQLLSEKEDELQDALGTITVADSRIRELEERSFSKEELERIAIHYNYYACNFPVCDLDIPVKEKIDRLLSLESN